MAGLPFEHSSKFGVVIQFILHPNWALALDQLYDIVGKKFILALWMGWVQDRAFLEIHPCWLESANAWQTQGNIPWQVSWPSSFLERFLLHSKDAPWDTEEVEQQVLNNTVAQSFLVSCPQVCVTQGTVDMALKTVTFKLILILEYSFEVSQKLGA